MTTCVVFLSNLRAKEVVQWVRRVFTECVGVRVHSPRFSHVLQVYEWVVPSHGLSNVVAILELRDLSQVEVFVAFDWFTAKINGLFEYMV